MQDSLTYDDRVLQFTCLGLLYCQYSLKSKHTLILSSLTPRKVLRVGVLDWDTQESSCRVLLPDDYNSLHLLSLPAQQSLFCGLALKYHGEQCLREILIEDDFQTIALMLVRMNPLLGVVLQNFVLLGLYVYSFFILETTHTLNNTCGPPALSN